MAEPPEILVCFAVKEEARPFTPVAASPARATVLVTGMGRRNSELTVRAACSAHRPSLIITAGFAGGLNPALATGTVIFDADPETALQPALLAAGAIAARFHCADRVAVTSIQKQKLWHETGADAVEMESQVIRAICRELGVPAATVRVILDSASEDLPLDFNDLMTDDMRVDGRKLALTIARSPGKIPALLALRKQTRAAANALAATLHKALSLRFG